MIDFLYKTLGKAPVVGQPITIAYITSKASDLVTGKSEKLDPEASKLAGKELEGHVNKKANALYDEHLSAEVNSTGFPSEVSDEIKKRAIKTMTLKLREQAMKKVV